MATCDRISHIGGNSSPGCSKLDLAPCRSSYENSVGGPGVRCLVRMWKIFENFLVSSFSKAQPQTLYSDKLALILLPQRAQILLSFSKGLKVSHYVSSLATEEASKVEISVIISENNCVISHMLKLCYNP